MNIPDEAVEALARRNFESEQGTAKWEQCWEDAKAGWRREARAQVEAIAPYLMAATLDKASDDAEGLGMNEIPVHSLRHRASCYRDGADK